MKELFEFIKRNISDFFSIIGIILTIYFSVFYIPDYVKNIAYQKQLRINEALIDNVQELVYNDYKIDVTQVESLIKGYEIHYQIKYEYTVLELYTQVQERFMSNRFIPLRIRQDLFQKIQQLKVPIINSSQPDGQVVKKSKSLFDWLSLLSTILGIIAGMLGFYGIYTNYRRVRVAEQMNEVMDSTSEIIDTLSNGIEFERQIRNIIKEAVLDLKKQATFSEESNNFDFVISLDNQHYFIETKYYQNPIPVSVLHNIVGKLGHNKGNIILICNVRLSKTASDFMKNFNSTSQSMFHTINSTNYEFIKSNLIKILNPSSQNS